MKAHQSDHDTLMLRWIVYSIIGRVGFGLPENAMVVVSGKDKGYKALLIATREIQKGEEIVIDHFMDWTESNVLEPDNLYERKVACNDREFDLNEKWIDIFKLFHDESLSVEQKQRILLELYPNGLTGKTPEHKFRALSGCRGLNSKDCTKRNGLIEAIDTEVIFGVELHRFRNNPDHESIESDKCTVDDKSCIEMEEQDVSEILIQRNRNQFHYDPESANDRKLTPHPTQTKFVHSALKLKYFGEDKQYGLITTKKIPFGSVLVVEYPVFMIDIAERQPFEDSMDSLEPMMYYVAKSVEKGLEIDERFKRIWTEEFRANQVTFSSWLSALKEHKRKIPPDQVMIDWAKFNTFWFGGVNGYKPIAIYSILSRVNYGIPQNVAAIFGEKEDDDVCVLIATRDLEEGEELTLDYFQNLHLKKSMSTANEWVRKDRGPEFGFEWTDDLRETVNKLHSDEVSSKEKRRLVHERLYSNGIIGKHGEQKLKIINGCDWLTESECETKKAIKEDIENGELFRIIKEKRSAAEWMGKEFALRAVGMM